MQDDIVFSLTRQRPANSAREPLRHSLGRPARARSLYIHVPFCFHKCHYCDFYSLVDTRDRQEPFVRRLGRELEALAPYAAAPLETIFVGGGTPSLLRVELWGELLRVLRSRFDLSGMGVGGPGEFTVECNPETVTPELMSVLGAGGVNRVSLGGQSFDLKHLKTLERWHEPRNVGRAVEMARGAGVERISVDLIFAIPGQSLEEWDRDLRGALALGVEHMSCYALTYEPNTAMTARLKRGEFRRADEDLEADMYQHTVEVLRAAGLERYEVSNFARPGAACRHNMAYWRQRDWLAAGPSASGHVAGARWKNVARLDDYLEYSDEGFAPVTDVEAPDAKRALVERIMTGVRIAEGLDTGLILAEAESLAAGTGARLARAADAQRALGTLTNSEGRWVLTEKGWLVADRVVLELMAAIDEPGGGGTDSAGQSSG